MRLQGTTFRCGLLFVGLAVLSMCSPDLVMAFVGQRGGPAGPGPGEPVLPQTLGPRGGGVASTSASQPGAAWWTNAILVARLGLTEDQKKKIEATFEQYRQTLVQNKVNLERDEAVLARMLETEPMEPLKIVSAQIERVVQGRGEMERTSSKMTLEIRQSLTRAQWIQLQAETLQPTAASAISPQRGRGGGRGGPPITPVGAPTP